MTSCRRHLSRTLETRETFFFRSPGSALSADQVSLGKRQEHAIYSRIIFGALQEVFLDARRGYVVDDQPSAGHEARDHVLVDLGVKLRGLDIGEAKRDLRETGRIVERVAMKDLDRTCRAGAGDALLALRRLFFHRDRPSSS